MILDSVIFSNPGGRDHNEDSAAWKDLPDGGLFVVADGLGGHRYGELASKCAADCLLGSGGPEANADVREWLQQQFALANEKILGLQAEKNGNMKSTLVALMIRGEKAYWAHTGDSRLYYFHRSTLAACTEDHSVAYKKYKAGEITRARIAQDEDQASLLRVLGNASHFEPDVSEVRDPLEPGDAFLMCTDGVWEYLSDDEALVDLLKAETAREWAELLLLRIIARVKPGNDNLSLITVLVR